ARARAWSADDAPHFARRVSVAWSLSRAESVVERLVARQRRRASRTPRPERSAFRAQGAEARSRGRGWPPRRRRHRDGTPVTAGARIPRRGDRDRVRELEPNGVRVASARAMDSRAGSLEAESRRRGRGRAQAVAHRAEN